MCNIYTLKYFYRNGNKKVLIFFFIYVDVFVRWSALEVPILWPASKGKALCGEFSELFQTKEKALHFFLIHRFVGLPSQAWLQQPQCFCLNGSLDVHLTCQSCSHFSCFRIHSAKFLLWNMKQPWPLPLSSNLRRFSSCVHQAAVLQRHSLLKASI